MSQLPSLTRQQVREVDRQAIEALGLPGVVLMENAGRHVADIVFDVLENDLHLIPPDAVVWIFCGGGNNGGDGYVIARYLANAGVGVEVFTTKAIDELPPDAATHARVAVGMGLALHDIQQPQLLQAALDDAPSPHVIVDALLGTGFEGGVRPDIAAVIEAINAQRSRGALVVAVDVPSGLDCQTGVPAEPVVAADITVTFIAEKVGFASPQAEPCLGDVEVVDIGIPPGLIGRVLADG